jgi:hypothetical protein
MVDDMASRISYFGKDSAGARKKAWMYMRWMVRPNPDLRLFPNFDPKDLEMPLDVNTCRAFAAIRRRLPNDQFLAKMSSDVRGIPIADAHNRRLATAFARALFANDPIVMDYPLFLLGRQNRFNAA